MQGTKVQRKWDLGQVSKRRSDVVEFQHPLLPFLPLLKFLSAMTATDLIEFQFTKVLLVLGMSYRRRFPRQLFMRLAG